MLQAPNYFSIIKNPMDFTTIRQRIASGAYQGWDDMLADLDLTFTNCMTYNPAGKMHALGQITHGLKRLTSLNQRRISQPVSNGI